MCASARPPQATGGTVTDVQRPFRATGSAAIAAVLMLTAAGCAADGSAKVAPPATIVTASTTTTADSSGGGVTPSAPSSTTAMAAAPEALQFSAAGVGGTTIDFAQFAGTPVVLWFWAPG